MGYPQSVYRNACSLEKQIEAPLSNLGDVLLSMGAAAKSVLATLEKAHVRNTWISG